MSPGFDEIVARVWPDDESRWEVLGGGITNHNLKVTRPDGVFVLRVDARKPADRVAFEARKKELRAQRVQQLKQQRLQAYFADLRKSAKIDDRRKEINARARQQEVT